MPDSKLVMEANKVITKDGPMYEITKLRAMEWDELPNDYLNGTPRVWMQLKSMYLHGNPKFICLDVGDLLSPSFFKELLRFLKQSGHRLQRIRNRMRREAGAGWSGSVKTEI